MRIQIHKCRVHNGKIYMDPFPVEKLKRVDRPTTLIMEDKVQRVDERESGFNKAARGIYGPRFKRPGLLLSGLFMATIYIMAKRNPELGPPGPKFTMREKVVSLKNTWSILSLFLLVIGGLYGGWFTPTEAAGVGAFGAFSITLLRRKLTWDNLKGSLYQTTLTTAMVFAILIGASIFGYFLTVSQIPEQLSNWIAGLGLNRYLVMAIIVFIYMVLGCFMEGLAIMVLTIPVIYPLVINLGFDPIWFGVIITLVMEMSLITPPVGVNVFVISGIAKDVPMYTIFRGVLPFWGAMVVCVALLIAFPQLALFLPGTMTP